MTVNYRISRLATFHLPGPSKCPVASCPGFGSVRPYVLQASHVTRSRNDLSVCIVRAGVPLSPLLTHSPGVVFLTCLVVVTWELTCHFRSGTWKPRVLWHRLSDVAAGHPSPEFSEALPRKSLSAASPPARRTGCRPRCKGWRGAAVGAATS